MPTASPVGRTNQAKRASRLRKSRSGPWQNLHRARSTGGNWRQICSAAASGAANVEVQAQAALVNRSPSATTAAAAAAVTAACRSRRPQPSKKPALHSGRGRGGAARGGPPPRVSWSLPSGSPASRTPRRKRPPPSLLGERQKSGVEEERQRTGSARVWEGSSSSFVIVRGRGLERAACGGIVRHHQRLRSRQKIERAACLGGIIIICHRSRSRGLFSSPQ